MKIFIVIFSISASLITLGIEKTYGIDVPALTGIWQEPTDLMDCTLIPCQGYGTNTAVWGASTPSSLLFEGTPFSFTEGSDEGTFIKIGELTWNNTSIPGPADLTNLLVPLALHFAAQGGLTEAVDFSGLVTNTRNDLLNQDQISLGGGPNTWVMEEANNRSGIELLGKISGTQVGPLAGIQSLTLLSSQSSFSFKITDISFGRVLFGPSQVIPEPTTILLFLTGLGGLGIWKRTKKAK